MGRVLARDAAFQTGNASPFGRLPLGLSGARNRLAIEKVRKLLLIANSRPSSRGRGVLAAAAIQEESEESGSDADNGESNDEDK